MMWTRIGVLMTAAWSAVAAQSKNRVELDVLMLGATYRDAVSSPLKYSGSGPGLAMTYVRRAWSKDVRFHLGVATPTLHSRITREGLPRQNLYRVRTDLSVLRSDAGDGTWRIGPRVSADCALRDHLPSGPEAFSFGYLFFHAALGPTVASSRSLRKGMVSWELSVPVAGFVVRPYTDTRIISRGGPNWRFASLAAAPSGDVRIAYAPAARPRRVDWRFTYQGHFARYDRTAPYREAESSLAVSLGLGRMTPAR